MKQSKFRIKQKMLLAFGMFALIPLVVGLVVVYLGVESTKKEQSKQIATITKSSMDMIERNFFERYGDVQAFGLNTVVQDQTQWYKQDGTNPVAKVMDNYMSTYTPVYELMLLVDTNGKVAAVNTVDWQAAKINTKSFYGKNFKDAEWFQRAIKGDFDKSEALTGTVVTDFHNDEELASILGHAEPVMGFAAPVKNSAGQVIGVWYNYARMSVVEGVFTDALNAVTAQGLTDGQITLVNSKGEVLAASILENGKPAFTEHVSDEKPYKDSTTEFTAKQKSGESGFTDADKEAVSEEDNQPHIAGWAKSAGALGYPGLGWSTNLRIAKKEFFASSNKPLYNMFLAAAIVLAATIVFALAFAKKMTAPIIETTEALKKIASGNVNCEVNHKGNDELGEASEACRQMLSYLQNKAELAQIVASGDLTVDVEIVSQDDAQGIALERMLKELNDVANVAEKLAGGDLTTMYEPRGEKDVLGLALQEMITKLRAVVTDISSSAGLVQGSSLKLKASAETVAEVASEIASSVEQVTMAANEASRSAQEIANGSEQLAINASNVANDTEELSASVELIRGGAKLQEQAISETEAGMKSANSAVKQAVAGTRRIREQIDSAAVKAEALDAKGKQIGGIVGAIEDIAEQTNLLALNAAIEAARAGEAGRGFSVVADEVRKLAERAQEATREISSLIESVRKDVAATVSAMRESSEEVAQVAEFADSVTGQVEEVMNSVSEVRNVANKNAEAVSQMIANVENVSQAIANVAAIAEEAAAGAEEMSASMQEVSATMEVVSNGVKQTSTTVQEVSGAANDLEGMANHLIAGVAHFKLGSTTALPDQPAEVEEAA